MMISIDRPSRRPDVSPSVVLACAPAAACPVCYGAEGT